MSENDQNLHPSPKDQPASSGDERDLVEVNADATTADHFNALRGTVIRAIIVPFIVFIVSWPFYEHIHVYLSSHLLAEDQIANLSFNEPLEGLVFSVKLAFYVAFLFGLPWILINIWFFISPGLYPHERRFARFALPLSMTLFFAGAAFGLYVVLPMTMDFLLNLGTEVVAKQNTSIASFYSLTFLMMMVLGICFQTPLLVAPLVRFGIIKPDAIKGKRRVVYFIIAVVAAGITPTGDPITMMAVAVPLALLLEVGIHLGVFWKKVAEKREREEPQSVAEGWREGISSLRKEREEGDGLLGAGAADSFAEAVGGMATKFAKDFADASDDLKELPEELEKLDAPSNAEEEAETEPVPATPKDQPESMQAVKASDIPKAPIAPKAPLPGVGRVETNVPGVEPGSQIPEYLLDPNRPVPKLPRELRRRIDHYVHQRLEELLKDVIKHEAESEDPKSEDTPPKED